MNKKVLRDILVCEIEGFKNGEYDLNAIINGEDLMEKDLDYGLDILDKNNLIRDGCFIIPKGMELTNTKDFGGATQYNFNNGHLLVDLAFGNDEYRFIG